MMREGAREVKGVVAESRVSPDFGFYISSSGRAASTLGSVKTDETRQRLAIA